MGAKEDLDELINCLPRCSYHSCDNIAVNEYKEIDLTIIRCDEHLLQPYGYSPADLPWTKTIRRILKHEMKLKDLLK